MLDRYLVRRLKRGAVGAVVVVVALAIAGELGGCEGRTVIEEEVPPDELGLCEVDCPDGALWSRCAEEDCSDLIQFGGEVLTLDQCIALADEGRCPRLTLDLDPTLDA